MNLDAALLDFWTAARAVLPYRPRAQQEAVKRAAAAVAAAARAEAEGACVDPADQLRAALDRAAGELGWSEVTLIVNAAGRRHAGPARRADRLPQEVA